jgi:hypothetical protein
MYMKKITLISITAALLIGATSCHNEEWEFPDFDYQGVYFPYQYPIRTLVLGDYHYDNENDNNLKFLVSARIGGMYENKWNWTVDYTLVDTLANNLLTSTGDTLKPLPAAYYTLSPASSITIPSGLFYGSVEVQLTEAFLNDANAHRVHYVLPLKITGSSADTILSGYPLFENADPRIAGQWSVTPKDFTIFGIKYVNPFHGKYLHRGQSVVRDGLGEVVETISYRQRYVEQDEVWALKTVSKDAVTLTGTLRKTPSSPGVFNLKLIFDENNNCVVESVSGFAASGSGKFVKDGDEWGGKKRDAIHLNFTVDDGTHTHTLSDTLVFRDKDVRFEEYVPSVYVPL